MPQISVNFKNARWCWAIFPVACAVVVIGAKCWMISAYGNPTPFLDQWDGEAATLYAPYFSGTLRLSDFFAAHNEHRILPTRLWSLLLLSLNGYWDPILQMVANAPLVGVLAALLVAAFRPLLDFASLGVLALFAMAMFALPTAWENTLGGFHSQWYFAFLTSLAGLFVLNSAMAFSARWWIAAVLLCASYFSMAPGSFALGAAAALCAIQIATGSRTGPREWLAAAALAALFIVAVWNIPWLAGHDPLKAHSIAAFLGAMVQIGSWPVLLPPARAESLLIAPLIHAPAIAMSAWLIRQRPPPGDRRWLVVGLAGWGALQAAAIAYGRAAGPTAPRYLDIFTIALVLDLACLLYLLRIRPDTPARRMFALGALTAWLLLVLPSAVHTSLWYSVPGMAQHHALGFIQTEHLRAYLATKDVSVLENKPFLHVPYPDARRLAEIASRPAIRAILPPALVGEDRAAATREHGVARFTGRAVDAFKRLMLRDGVLLMPIGLALALVGLLLGWRRTEPEPGADIGAA